MIEGEELPLIVGRLEEAPPVKDVVQRASGSFEGRNNHGGPG